MTPPAVSAPPRPAAPAAGAPVPAAELRARPPFSRPRRPRPRLRDPRTLGASLALHLAATLLLLNLPPRELRVPAAPPADERSESVSFLDVSAWGGMATDASASLDAAIAAGAAVGPGAIDSLRLRVAPGGDGVAFPRVAPATGGGGGTGPVSPGPPGTGAGEPSGVPGAPGGAAGMPRTGPGSLGPEFGDRRLVVPASAVADRELTELERYRRHFEGRIDAVNDSIAGEAERARRANDWTITDRNGNRWGIDDRGVVVGGQRVPTPRPGVGRPQRDREEVARREREQRAEIDRQADAIERERHLRERQRQIRERNDRERAAREGTGTP
jgi:hypothetical protein